MVTRELTSIEIIVTTIDIQLSIIAITTPSRTMPASLVDQLRFTTPAGADIHAAHGDVVTSVALLLLLPPPIPGPGGGSSAAMPLL